MKWAPVFKTLKGSHKYPRIVLYCIVLYSKVLISCGKIVKVSGNAEQLLLRVDANSERYTQ